MTGHHHYTDNRATEPSKGGISSFTFKGWRLGFFPKAPSGGRPSI